MTRRQKGNVPRLATRARIGQCYYNTFHAILRCKHGFARKPQGSAIEFTGFHIVHGLLLIPADGKYGGKLLGHAWIEDRDNVYEFPRTLREKPVVTARAAYYELFSINEDRVRRYKPLEAVRASLEAGHCGPWDVAVEQDWGIAR